MRRTKRVSTETKEAPVPKRISISRQLMRLKETKRRVADASGTGIAVGGLFIDISQWNTAGYDTLEADRGYLVGVRIKAYFSASAAISNVVRLVLLKSKQADDISSSSYMFLDADTTLGAPGRSSTEVLLAEQIVFPINKDAFVVKMDRLVNIGATGTSPDIHVLEKYIPFKNEKFELPRAAVEQDTSHYYLAVFGIEGDGTASTANYAICTELLFKDGV